MKKIVFIFLCMLCANIYSQQLINIQNGSKTEFYTSLEEAIEKSTSGDTLYLPGATLQVNDNITINKKLVIIGAGWDMDSIGGVLPTQIQKGTTLMDVTFTNGSAGSVITGCILNQIRISTQNIIIWRNKVAEIYLGLSSESGTYAENIFIKENWILNKLHGQEASNCIISNNFFQRINNDYYFGGFRNSSILNNVLISSGLANCRECKIENNYFDYNHSYITDCIFRNNAYSSTPTFLEESVGYDNLTEQSLMNSFGYTSFSHPKQCDILEASPCKNAGTDGSDIGIYGGSSPYKKGAIPFNPHINKSNISVQTDKSGKLKIDIIVSAQDR